VNLAIATMHRARHRLPRAQVGRVKMSLLLVMVLAYSPVATAMADGPSAAGQASSSGEPALCRDVGASRPPLVTQGPQGRTQVSRLR